jgi:hypothetical protein
VTCAFAGSAQALTIHVPRNPAFTQNVRLRFSAPALTNGGYYYGVAVLRPSRRYTRESPPPCSTSSDMQRTDYGYPQAGGLVALALTPAKSRTKRWCRGGSYEGAIYAVPHAPPCEAKYPCRSEPYEPPSPCWDVGGHIACGVVARPTVWHYPDPLPKPLAAGTTIVARFSLRFASK